MEALLEIVNKRPYNLEAWSSVITQIKSKKINDVRMTFEKLVSIFQLSPKYWKIYIEAEMRAKNYENAEKLFAKCLMKIFDCDLWHLYLRYVRESKSSTENFREVMSQAYDFALDQIGMDVRSQVIWCEYIEFLKSSVAVGTYAENQKILMVRKAYQRALVTPIYNIESLWRDYTTFEAEVNTATAKKIIEERSKSYMNARRVLKEMEAVTRGIRRSEPSRPSSFNQKDQLNIWKKYIAWEKSNPLNATDLIILYKRVMFVYEQSLLCLSYFPEMWISAVQYLRQISTNLEEKGGKTATYEAFLDQGSSLFERAISSTMLSNSLVHFIYADYEEEREHINKAKEIYEKAISIKEENPTLAYIHYMHFSRRNFGIKQARLVFKRGREDTRSDCNIFISSALLEFQCSKDKGIALKIFELGFKKFAHVHDYIREYLYFVKSLNEENNTRVLYERVLSSGSLSLNQQTKLWNEFLAFECQVGEFTNIEKVFQRKQAVLLNSQSSYDDILSYIDRFSYANLLPCNSTNLKRLNYYSFNSSEKNLLKDDQRLSETIEVISPDPDQMLPFKPSRNQSGAGLSQFSDGSFSYPSFITHILQKLPSSNSFFGPFVKLDPFIDMINKWIPPETQPTNFANPLPEEIGSKYVKKSVMPLLLSNQINEKAAIADNNNNEAKNNSNLLYNGLNDGSDKLVGSTAQDISSSLMKSQDNDQDDLDEDDTDNLESILISQVPPVNDVYRSRQSVKQIKRKR